MDAAFDAGLLALKLGDSEGALQLHKTAVELEEEYGLSDRLQQARDEREALPKLPEGDINAVLQEKLLQEILKMLEIK